MQLSSSVAKRKKNVDVNILRVTLHLLEIRHSRTGFAFSRNSRGSSQSPEQTFSKEINQSGRDLHMFCSDDTGMGELARSLEYELQ
jgi:hypothetical protein